MTTNEAEKCQSCGAAAFMEVTGKRVCIDCLAPFEPVSSNLQPSFEQQYNCPRCGKRAYLRILPAPSTEELCGECYEKAVAVSPSDNARIEAAEGKAHWKRGDDGLWWMVGRDGTRIQHEGISPYYVLPAIETAIIEAGRDQAMADEDVQAFRDALALLRTTYGNLGPVQDHALVRRVTAALARLEGRG